MQPISVIYDDLLKVNISLDFDNVPTPKYLQDKIFECSTAMHKVEKHAIESTREMSGKDKEYRLEKSKIEIKKREILTSNESVKKLPTGKERESAAEELLEDDYKNLLELETRLNELKNLLTAIKLVQQNLKGTNSDIKMLMKLMEQQINRLNIGLPDDPEMASLNKTFAEIDEMEEEMTLDDVESSEESIDSEDGQEDAEEETPEDTSDADDQVSEESSVKSDSDDEEDLDIASFLGEDATDFSSEDETKESAAEDAQEQEQVAQSEDSGSEPLETGDTKGSEEAVEVEDSGDLNMDLGDLDLGNDTSTETPVEESSEVLIEEDKVEETESPPEEENEVSISDTEEEGFDIEEILTSID